MKNKIKLIVNILTLSRIIGACILPIIFTYIDSLFGLLALTLLLATDAVDGFLARKYDVCTKGGFHLDQFCDKILGISALLCLIRIEFNLILPLIFEVSIALVNIIRATNNKSGSSSIIGKIKTFSFSIMLILVAAKIYMTHINNTIIIISIIVTGVLELLTLIGYIKEALNEKRGNSKSFYKEKIKSFSDIKIVIKRLWNEEEFISDRDKPIQEVIEEELKKTHNKEVR